ncbi:MAG: TonB-dependent receptor [Tannerella sp.]|nr:TonB-dependent receptor [Tannerella sp.]
MHKSVSIGVVATCMLTLAHSTETAAQTVSVPQHFAAEDSIAEQLLDEVTVTASRTETPLSRTTKIVAVITRDEIAQAPVQSVEDLLNYVAGVDVVQRGGHGVQADISLRGGSADQTAVLLNGVNLSNSHTGHYSFDVPVNLSDIERIEILHGPAALIFGSSAFSGGINIVTRRSADVPAPVKATLEAGSYKLIGAEARGEAQIGKTFGSLSVRRSSSDGYIANSDYEIYNALWQTRWKPSQNSRLDFMTGYNKKQYGANTFYSAAYPNQYERTSSVMGAVNGVFGNKLKFIPQLYWNRHYDRFDLIKDSLRGRNYHRSDTYGANIMFRYTSRFGDSHFGGEARREEIISSALGKSLANEHGKYKKYDSRTNANIVFEHTYVMQKFVFSAGALANYNTLQDDKLRFYPSLSASFRPIHTLRLVTSWSRSSRLPTFTDLYYTTETHNANETLQAETSESFDLSADYQCKFFTAVLTGYLMKGRNMIDWVRSPGETKWASWNHTTVDKQGIEATVRFPLRSLSRFFDESSALTISYAKMFQDCNTEGLESRYTLNYLRDKFTASIKHNITENFHASWNLRYQNRMGEFTLYQSGVNTGRLTPYDPFTILDLRLWYDLGKITVKVDLNNIFDRRYYDIGNVPQAGFWAIAGISYGI